MNIRNAGTTKGKKMEKYTITINNKFTKTMTAEAFYLNYGLNLHKANAKGIIKDRFNEYKITAN